MIVGHEAPKYGQAKNSWLTGSASWSLVALQEWLLGVRADYDGLIIDPHLPSYEFPHLSIKRIYRGVTYLIEVDNTSKNPSLYVEGKMIEGKTIPFSETAKIVHVELR